MPAAERPRRRPPYRLALGLVAALAAFAMWTVIVQTGVLHHAELHLLDWLWSHQSAALAGVARGFAIVGRFWVLAPATLVAAALLTWRGRFWQGLYVVLTMATESLLDLLLKQLFRRARPGIDLGEPSSYAYPSGHSMAAAAFATALVFVAWPTRWRWPVLVAGLAFAVLMGASRVYLTVHWPSDVVAGWLLGFAVAAWLRLAMDAAFAPRDGAAGRRAGRPPARRRVDVVLFDWGGTLMVDDGTRLGPMVSWPRVAAVDGAQETLRRLRPRYRLWVATNADDSSGPDVRAALARVGLDALIDGVVSSRDVGVRKPDPAFFDAALRQAGAGRGPVAAAHAVMVGDRPDNDVGGAKRAGLRAVWLNPGRSPLPPGSPAPDAVIAHLRDLPEALARLAQGR